MSDSLRDQLLGLGFKPAPVADKPKGPRRKDGPGGKGRTDARGKGPGPADAGSRRGGQGAKGQGPKGARGPGGRGPRPDGDIDLAKAYAIRAQREKDERIRVEREKQEAARLRREAQAKLATLLEGKGLNAADAEHVRHFEYGGKIKRIHVTEEQLRALNAGELGVVQRNGRYLLVTAATLAEAEAIFPAAVALRVDPNAPAEDDPYADPKYQVPDDLVW
ncbi:DUF2058 domain-containing protein [Luteimonas arsenica]|uniref:DUF2058 domain-containing protein n=1 Tax=Luteimonas arsenica TaxID=1586242 RepID=UPI0010567F67|nr:DUF2058 family protein [Luteimonas arsenica]